MIYLFGKSQDKILKLIKEDEMRTKMTREEAKLKLKSSVLGVRGTVANEQAIDDWLNGLEALGLIKFEEPSIDQSWKIFYKSMSLSDLVDQLTTTNCNRYSDRKERINFIKSEIQLKLDRY